MSDAESILQNGISEYTNVAMLIWLTEIAYSSYFNNWDKIKDLFDAFRDHFIDLVQRAIGTISCSISSYSEWLDALVILNRYRASIDEAIHKVAFANVVSNLGLKAKFVSERLNEKGWEVNGE